MNSDKKSTKAKKPGRQMNSDKKSTKTKKPKKYSLGSLMMKF